MTAEYLVTEIFSRPQQGVASDMRLLTERQFAALRGLILTDKTRGADVHYVAGLEGSLAWMPPGPVKYVLTEDRVRGKHLLTRMSTAAVAESGRLF